jgi:hypothetical protein
LLKAEGRKEGRKEGWTEEKKEDRTLPAPELYNAFYK